jgi:hypothetical protein
MLEVGLLRKSDNVYNHGLSILFEDEIGLRSRFLEMIVDGYKLELDGLEEGERLSKETELNMVRL